MSYQTYITNAVIVGSFDSNTADKSYLLFTRDAGMIYASARSVREERSRQRFALQDFSRITVSLIKGKTGWRIGSVQSEGNYFVEANDRAVRGSIVRICKLLRRFVAGEEPHPDLYEEIVAGLEHLVNPTLPNRNLIEEIILARVLYRLGYIASASDIAPVLDTDLSTLFTTELKDTLLARLKTITTKATTASHL
ncbi:recombination protein O N-terminal domain-containing protein [Patescibacteria group bacterium]|nr:recombination protein O N-terminal domain-containing protein [Patescibacteria group bacterium]